MRGLTVVKHVGMKRTVVACVFAAVISPGALAEVETGGVELKCHTDMVWALAFSADGKLLASGSADATVAVWDVRRRRLLARLEKHGREVIAVAFHPNGTLLAAGDVDGKIVIWDLRSGRPACELNGHTKRVTCMAFSPDARHLVSTSNDGKGQLWFLRTGTAARTFRWEEETTVRAAAFSPDGRLIAIGRTRRHGPRSMGVAELWDAGSGKPVKELTRDGSVPYSFAFSADGRYIQAGCSNGSAPLWEIESGKFIRGHDGHKRRVNAVMISPDARHFLTGSPDGCVKLWDFRKGEVLREFKTLPEEALEQKEGEPWATAKRRQLFSAAFSPDCRTFVTGGGDGVVRVWSLPEEFDVTKAAPATGTPAGL